MGGLRLLLLTPGCLLRGLLALLGGLPGRILRLSGGLTCCVLGLLGCLPRLVRYLSGRVLSLARGLSDRILRLARNLLGLIRSLPRRLLSLARGLTCGVLHTLGDLPNLVGHPAERATAALLLAAGEATGQAADRVLHLTGSLAGGVLGLVCDLAGLVRGLPRNLLGLACYLTRLVGRLTCYLLSLACYLSGRVLRLPSYLLGLIRCLSGGLTCGVLGLLGGLACSTVFGFHSLGGLYHVAYDDTSLATRSFDLRKVDTPVFRFATGRVRGLDLSLAPDLVRVQTGDVLLRLVYAIFHGGVVVHQLLKERLEGFLSPPRDLVREAFERGPVISYALFEHLGRITEVLLSKVHGPLLDLAP